MSLHFLHTLMCVLSIVSFHSEVFWVCPEHHSKFSECNMLHVNILMVSIVASLIFLNIRPWARDPGISEEIFLWNIFCFRCEMSIRHILIILFSKVLIFCYAYESSPDFVVYCPFLFHSTHLCLQNSSNYFVVDAFK